MDLKPLWESLLVIYGVLTRSRDNSSAHRHAQWFTKASEAGKEAEKFHAVIGGKVPGLF